MSSLRAFRFQKPKRDDAEDSSSALSFQEDVSNEAPSSPGTSSNRANSSQESPLFALPKVGNLGLSLWGQLSRLGLFPV